jgi:hypothetical protein
MKKFANCYSENKKGKERGHEGDYGTWANVTVDRRK